MGRRKLHTVVSPKGKDVGKAPSSFHYWLSDLNKGKGLPGLDQVLPGLFEIFVADAVRRPWWRSPPFTVCLAAGCT
ncbi:hypothetical protein SynWH8101_1260 [Synechococcus sp. WH 8101]|uniref:hypothetical protein n=1 Tax=Synechococcus sp. WH 8101 TaxID=59932 RepID=UPI001022A8FF|nr:hypothetical protein [Synechococcus sp. WH 8101]QBE68846.1 hypothetical protein SynWH8101_1260 [Synechococcus sp. WH 8101]